MSPILDDDAKIVIELVVIHDIARYSPITYRFYEWLSEVINTACYLRRNIQVKKFPYIWDIS
jgi:hypothetical protein